MKIGFASDHRGYALKQQLMKELSKEYDVVDYGTHSEESTDYPDYAFLLGENVANKQVSFGVAICGSGIGISIACNKVKGVRCAKVNDEWEAKMTRLDNDANVIAIGSRLPIDDLKNIIRVFLETEFSGIDRHQRRIDLINNYNG